MLRKKQIALIVLFLIGSAVSHAQFYDNFDGDNIKGWFTMTGDGNISMQFIQQDNYASLLVDATADKYNVYWALIKRDITKYLNLSLLKDTLYQLRVEARVRIHDAPRRVNFMVNTNRTVNYHIDLKEYDLPDTNQWYTISMTTKKFDAVPGDQVFVQFAATDFGIGKHSVDVDYYKADIVNIKQSGPDVGRLVPYHPDMPPAGSFTYHLDAKNDCVINSDFPDVNFNNWSIKNHNGTSSVMTVNANQWAIIRWDFSELKNKTVNEPGLLELSTYSVSKGGNYNAFFGGDLGIEFGKVRVIEIKGGDPEWDQEKVTYNSLLQGKSPDEVINPQMVFDTEVNEMPGGKTYITLSKYVLQRLLSGTTKGLIIKPLGSIDATFFSSENGNGPELHFNAE